MDAKAVHLHQVLEGEKQYIVPVFQRYYSWYNKHWIALWEDIETLEENEGIKEHFMGALVCMADKHTPYATPRYTLIDGQQRLTTLAIFFVQLGMWHRHMRKNTKKVVQCWRFSFVGC